MGLALGYAKPSPNGIVAAGLDLLRDPLIQAPWRKMEVDVGKLSRSWVLSTVDTMFFDSCKTLLFIGLLP